MKVVGDYDKDGYAVIEGLVPPEVGLAFLQQINSDLDGAGVPLTSLRQTSSLLRREAIEVYGYHYRPMLMFLWGLTPIMSQLTGRDLLPTYDYFRIYREGDVCRVHSDRHSCEHSLSLTLDYSDGVPWDIEIGSDRLPEPLAQVDDDFGGSAHRSITMQPGDALLYQGVHHRHGRMTPNPNAWSAHLFLHWVDRGGPYAKHAFDERGTAIKPLHLNFG